MDFELRRAREKLAKEQSERKERARLRLERERKAKAEASRQRDAIEAAQRSRRIDAAEAQLKADEDMQESLMVGRGVAFYRLLEAVPFDGVGDKIKLPSSCFSELSDQRAFDMGPLYFQLSVADGGGEEASRKTAHSGVLEFTAEENSVGVPPHVWRNLFGTTDPATTNMVEVRYFWLPKGIYAKIRPDTAGFSDLPNHKAILETSLRRHATLSEGEVFSVRYGDLAYELRVLELKPSSSVSVLETDLEVDLESDSASLASERRHALRPIEIGKPESGSVGERDYEYFKFTVDEPTQERVASGHARVEIKLESEIGSDDGDTDLYVSSHPLIFPTQHQHGWSSHEVGSKTLILGDKSFTAGNYSIGIYGFKGTTKYTLSVTIADLENRSEGQRASSSSTTGSDTVECRNCRRNVPSHTVALHEAYCSRHNVMCGHVGCGVVLRGSEAGNHVHCDKCGLAFQKGDLEKHVKVFHEPVRCPCGVVLHKEQMVNHQAESCPLRLIVCRFCGDMVTAGSSAPDARDRMRGLSEHESVCGSRTAPCDSCGRSVMLKEMDIHHVAVHQNN